MLEQFRQQNIDSSNLFLRMIAKEIDVADDKKLADIESSWGSVIKKHIN